MPVQGNQSSIWQKHKQHLSSAALLVMKVNIFPAKAICPFITLEQQHQKIISEVAKSFH